MNADSADYKFSELTDKIICSFYAVYNKLGYGFLEKVYEKAFLYELKKIGLNAESQVPIQVLYDGINIGEYFADILVENIIIVEVKAASSLALEHEAQLLNYLKATDLEVGLLFNFGPKPAIKRKAYNNSRKKS